MDSGKRKNDESIDRATQNARKKLKNDHTERDRNWAAHGHETDQQIYSPPHRQQQQEHENNQQRTNRKKVTWEDQIKRK